jgi:hypothetical protein
MALAEYESGDRDLGVYSRLYSKNAGDERRVKAAYLEERAIALMQLLTQAAQNDRLDTDNTPAADSQENPSTASLPQTAKVEGTDADLPGTIESAAQLTQTIEPRQSSNGPTVTQEQNRSAGNLLIWSLAPTVLVLIALIALAALYSDPA